MCVTDPTVTDPTQYYKKDTTTPYSILEYRPYYKPYSIIEYRPYYRPYSIDPPTINREFREAL